MVLSLTCIKDMAIGMPKISLRKKIECTKLEIKTKRYFARVDAGRLITKEYVISEQIESCMHTELQVYTVIKIHNEKRRIWHPKSNLKQPTTQ